MREFRLSLIIGVTIAAAFLSAINTSTVLAQQGIVSTSAAQRETTMAPRSDAKRTKKSKNERVSNINVPSQERDKIHRLAVQVNANDPAAMNLALNNVSNVAE